MIKPKVVLLIFVSGKIVLTGAKVSGHALGVYLLLLHMLIFLFVCEGAGGDLHGVQHDLHRAMRVPQAVMTASCPAPPAHTRAGSRNSLRLLRGCTPRDTSLLMAAVKTGRCFSVSQEVGFCLVSHAHPLSPPYPARIYFAIPYYKIHIAGLAVFVLVIALSMTVYNEAQICGPECESVYDSRF
jgi:Transcription factor TFIID (or TATA-binding protein, TBP)